MWYHNIALLETVAASERREWNVRQTVEQSGRYL